jgi:hypothetical protein
VLASSHGEAAVLVASALDVGGRPVVAPSSPNLEAQAEVRAAGEKTWSTVTLTAVDVTTYHATDVRRRKPSES